MFLGQIETQRQQLPLQHDCAEGGLPLATKGTSAPSEPSPSSPGKAPSHCVPATGSTCTHIHLICSPSPGLASALELSFSSRDPQDHHRENSSQGSPSSSLEQIKVQTVSLKGTCQSSVQGLGERQGRKQQKEDFICCQEPEPNLMGVGKSTPGTGHGVIITIKGASVEEIIEWFELEGHLKNT